jgi:single-stranded-DNA-specific exonuclease
MLIDAELDLGLADEEWLETQERLAPFGTSNARPLLFSRGVRPSSEPRILKEKHLRLDLRTPVGRRPAIWFQGALEDLPRPPWDVAYTVHRNTWQGRDEVQLQVVAVRSAS